MIEPGCTEVSQVSSSLEIPPELCQFEKEIEVGSFKKHVSFEWTIPSEEPLDVQIVHCFDIAMRAERLPIPFFERMYIYGDTFFIAFLFQP